MYEVAVTIMGLLAVLGIVVAIKEDRREQPVHRPLCLRG